METMTISNEPEIRGYGAWIDSSEPNARRIMVIGDREEQPWIRSGAGPVKVFRESRFAAEWPANAADNAAAHIWISNEVTVQMPEIVAASVTRESPAES